MAKLTHLVDGESLLRGQSIVSPNGKYEAFMNISGFVTLFRFEAGRDPVKMWRHACFTQQPYGATWMGIRGGFLAGGDHRNQNRETVWWAAPRNGLGARPTNTILVVQDDGNMVLYNRDATGRIVNAAWATNTHGSYPASIDPRLPVAMVSAGSLAINANTLIENKLTSPITVSDGQTAVTLQPTMSVAANSPAGPGTLLIDVNKFVYDLDDDAGSLSEKPQIRTNRSGNTLQLVAGSPVPFDWQGAFEHGFPHLQISRTQALEDTETLHNDTKQGGEPELPFTLN